MTYSLREALETAALILISGLLFIAFFDVNDWAFADMEYREGVNWIFLPAGFRVVLVLVMGLPASVGIMLGTWFIDREGFQASQPSLILLNGVVSGFTPWIIMKMMERRGKFGTQLRLLNSTQLLNFTLMYAAGNAVLHELGWWLMDHASVNLWVDIWPMFIGDAVGALIMLYAFKGLLGMLKPAARTSNSDRF